MIHFHIYSSISIHYSSDCHNFFYLVVSEEYSFYAPTWNIILEFGCIIYNKVYDILFLERYFPPSTWLDVAEKVSLAVESQTFRCQSLILAACSETFERRARKCRIGPLSTSIFVFLRFFCVCWIFVFMDFLIINYEINALWASQRSKEVLEKQHKRANELHNGKRVANIFR